MKSSPLIRFNRWWNCFGLSSNPWKYNHNHCRTYVKQHPAYVTGQSIIITRNPFHLINVRLFIIINSDNAIIASWLSLSRGLVVLPFNQQKSFAAIALLWSPKDPSSPLLGKQQTTTLMKCRTRQLVRGWRWPNQHPPTTTRVRCYVLTGLPIFHRASSYPQLSSIQIDINNISGVS